MNWFCELNGKIEYNYLQINYQGKIDLEENPEIIGGIMCKLISRKLKYSIGKRGRTTETAGRGS